MLADDAMFSLRHQGKVKSFQGRIRFVCLSLAGGLIFVTSTVRNAICQVSQYLGTKLDMLFEIAK